MKKRINYYKDLAADYSKPDLVSKELTDKLIAEANRMIVLKERALPAIGSDYSLEQIEKENKDRKSVV